MSTRYRLESTLGQGGMGTISRAYDRLTGTHVALKQLTLALEGAGDADPLALRRALAEEFRLLATLRHPHIVSVLDYGFIGPTAFYTMELFGAATTLTRAAQGQTFAQHLALLTQLLQALEYLRRHHVVHRDLKPENVLVQAGQVKILDFGLAVLEGHTSDTAGSLYYMAPEVLADQPASHATDLFAAGVLAYEILAGRRPFAAEDLDALVQQICEAEPDYAALAGPAAALQPVIARLLAKDPAARFATANDALAALVYASAQTVPLETRAARASFLQSAQFVGRAAEREQLTQALTAACAGSGSAWLISGENGVGKSRLVEELRIQALVQGALVWSGRALDVGGQLAQVWREILRWLALLAAPDDFEASVLKPFVPDLVALLERPVPDAPAIEESNAQTRFFATVLALLRRVTASAVSSAPQPLVLLLDDLQWIGPLSLALLTWVVRAAPELRLLVVGLYRDEERPALPESLPGAQVMTLKRLTPAQVTELVSAILGQSAAALPRLTEFLYQQTEGNAFFLVEVLRTLAEEAGLLSQVTQMALPTHVLAEGIQQVVQRRLQRVVAADYALLELAALDGRELDMPLLQHLAPEVALTPWLNRCAEAAVLEPVGAAWRFAHEQLRQGVLASLQAKPELHQQLAEGIEQVYPTTLAAHLGRLVYHYSQTPLTAKQRHYLLLAARAERAAFDNTSALEFYNQLALLLTTAPPAEQIEVHLERGAVLEFLGRWDEAEADYHAVLALSTASELAQVRARSQHALGVLHRQKGSFPAALDWLGQARTTWETLGNQRGLGNTLTEIANVHWRTSDYVLAVDLAHAGLALSRAAGDQPAIALALNILGAIAYRQGDYAPAHTFYTESLALRRALGDKLGITMSLNNLGLVAWIKGDQAAAQALHAESLALKREIGDKQGIAVSLNNLGLMAYEQQDYPTARALYEESLALRQTMGDQRGIVLSYYNLGVVVVDEGAYARAWELLTTSLRQAQTVGDKRLIALNLAALASLAVNTGAPQRAAQLLAAAETGLATIKDATSPSLRRQFDRTLAAAHAALDEAAFNDAWAAGTKMTFDEAVPYALQGNL